MIRFPPPLVPHPRPTLPCPAVPRPALVYPAPPPAPPPLAQLALDARSNSAAAAVKPKAPLSRSLHGVDVDGPGCGAHAFLSPTHKVPGFHLACIEQQPGGGDVVSVTLFPHGQGAGNQTLAVQMAGVGEDEIESAREILFVRRSRLNVCRRALLNPC